MSRRVSRVSIVAAIVLKDLREFARDKLWILVAPFSLAIMVAMFWLLPSSVNEQITVGIHVPGYTEMVRAFEPLGKTRDVVAKGLKLVVFDSEEELKQAVAGELDREGVPRVPIGVVVPVDFITAIWTGKKSTVRVYVDTILPDDLRRPVGSAVREVAYALRSAATGKDPIRELPIEIPALETVVLGEDRAGMQVPFREKVRPMLAIIVLLIESMALAGLIAAEIQNHTVTAMLVTPATVGDILAAKSIVGAILGMSQAVVFLMATWAFNSNWALVLVLMFLGAAMMSAVAMISGSLGKDFMNTLFYSSILIIPMVVPFFTVIFRGSTAAWVKVLPTYGLVEAIHGAIAYSRGWGDLYPYVGMVLLWDAILFGVGVFVLKRKVETL